MAGTDCGDCGYPDCFGYSDAIAQGKDFSSEKCAPGGADSKAMLETILVSLKTVWSRKYRMAALGDTIKTWCPRKDRCPGFH